MAFNTPAPALYPSPLRTKVADYQIVNGDSVVFVDATGGPVTITFPLALGSATSSVGCFVIKIDETSNEVLISDGTNFVDAIITPASADGQIRGSRYVISNGTTLSSQGANNGTQSVPDITTLETYPSIVCALVGSFLVESVSYEYVYDAASSAVAANITLPQGSVPSIIVPSDNPTNGRLLIAETAQDVLSVKTTADAALPKAGGETTGLVTATGGITGLPTPSNPSDAARKQDVDAVASGVIWNAFGAKYATTAALPAYTYGNGAAGVGATITFTATGVYAPDGTNLALNDTLLVKNETGGNTPYNGKYTCTTAPAVGVAGILTRSTDADQPSELNYVGYAIASGTVNVGTGYGLPLDTASITIGTTDLVFGLLPSAISQEAAARAARDSLLAALKNSGAVTPSSLDGTFSCNWAANAQMVGKAVKAAYFSNYTATESYYIGLFIVPASFPGTVSVGVYRNSDNAQVAIFSASVTPVSGGITPLTLNPTATHTEGVTLEIAFSDITSTGTLINSAVRANGVPLTPNVPIAARYNLLSALKNSVSFAPGALDGTFLWTGNANQQMVGKALKYAYFSGHNLTDSYFIGILTIPASFPGTVVIGIYRNSDNIEVGSFNATVTPVNGGITPITVNHTAGHTETFTLGIAFGDITATGTLINSSVRSLGVPLTPNTAQEALNDRLTIVENDLSPIENLIGKISAFPYPFFRTQNGLVASGAPITDPMIGGLPRFSNVGGAQLVVNMNNPYQGMMLSTLTVNVSTGMWVYVADIPGLVDGESFAFSLVALSTNAGDQGDFFIAAYNSSGMQVGSTTGIAPVVFADTATPVVISGAMLQPATTHHYQIFFRTHAGGAGQVNITGVVAGAWSAATVPKAPVFNDSPYFQAAIPDLYSKVAVIQAGLPTTIPDVVLPDALYALVGQQFNLYDDPLTEGDYADYVWTTTCAGVPTNASYLIGPTEYSDGLRWTPASTVAPTSIVKNLFRVADTGLIAVSSSLISTTIQAAAANAKAGITEHVLNLGDSLTAYCGNIYQCAALSAAEGGGGYGYVPIGSRSTALDATLNPVAQGTAGSTQYANEGRGGWTINDYADTNVGSPFRTFYAFTCSGVGTPPIGNDPFFPSVYTNNSSTFTVRDVFSLGGGGYTIVCERTSGTNAPNASGTLTRTTAPGDVTITYSAVATQNANPLLNRGTGLLDLGNYLTTYGLTVPDKIVMMLGTNNVINYLTDAATTGAMATNLANLDKIQTMVSDYNTAHSTSIKLFIKPIWMPPYSQDAFGDTYGYNSRAIYKRQAVLFNKALIQHYQGQTGSGTYLCGSYTAMDMVNNVWTNPPEPINSINTSLTVSRQKGGVHSGPMTWQQAGNFEYAMCKAI